MLRQSKRLRKGRQERERLLSFGPCSLLRAPKKTDTIACHLFVGSNMLQEET